MKNIILDEINKNENIKNKNLAILKIQFSEKDNSLKLFLKGDECLLSIEEKYIMENINKLLKENLNINVKIEIIFYKKIKNITLEQIVTQRWLDCINDVVSKNPRFKPFFSNCKTEVNNETIIIKTGYSEFLNYAKNKKLDILIQNSIKNLFGISSKVVYEFDSQLENNLDFNLIKNNIRSNPDSSVVNTNVKEKTPKKVQSYKKENNYRREAKSQDSILGRNISTELSKISEITEASGNVAILGEVFKTDIIETKTGKVILTFYITDYSNSITVKCFLKSDEKDKILAEVKKGLYCKVRGEAIYDTYSKEVVIMGRDILRVRRKQKTDNAPKKRVELHCHTTMSAMDGIANVKSIIERASKWGHKALAITDHGVVQAFPDAQSASKGKDIKIIYGMEGYLVNDGIPIVINEKNQNLETSYVIFDIETTGLSSKNDEIIEIGALKIVNGEIVDSFSEFVNPKISIPYKITELTNITDSMVKYSETIEEVLPKFVEFIGDSVLVAHNASFDCGFISKSCFKNNIEFDYTVLDTVSLCRFLYPQLKSVKLNLVAKHLGINLKNHHRAIDDAKATADIFLTCVKKIKDTTSITTLGELNEEFLKDVDIKRLPTNHIIILAKNQEGIQDLYRLVSKSNLSDFHKKPRIKKSELIKYRKNFIIGSACEGGEVYKSLVSGNDDDYVKELIKFYDYLEIQPLLNNEYLVRTGKVKSFDELKSINKKVYELGLEYSKLTVATGDVHFLDAKDEVFRRIIQAGQGFTDADYQGPLYFRTTDEMLKEFEYLGDKICNEVVIENTNAIADLIEDKLKPIPDETFTPKIDGSDDEIRRMTLEKVYSIYGENLPEVVQQRLDKELGSIINNGYAVLYLIAQKLVAKSYEDGYLVGSRGSVGSSFVATMVGITEVNGLPPHYVCPNCKSYEFFLDGSVSSGADLENKNCPKCGSDYIRDGHDIPFETFLGFEGDKEPDIDLNFSGDNQGDIHKYTEVLFGSENVFKAGTIGTIAEKTAFGFVKKYIDQKEMIVSQAEISRLTIGCTGIKRTTGQHPGGIMVVPDYTNVYNFTPIQRPADDVESDITTTHFDYHSISGRLLKLDILGHDDPTVLRMLQDLTGIDPRNIPLNDKKVLSLFVSPKEMGITREALGCEVGSYGLPEFGTKFVRQMLVDTQPKTFSDLARISGLSHGTDVWLNNAQYFIKEGYTTLRDCIATRDDIMVYLMYKGVEAKIAFNIMESVRKGKGVTKEQEEIMKEKKVEDWYIESCKRIKYMFPKGHAVAYVMMAVRVAYFKLYYPIQYYAAYFTVRGADDFDADLICKGEGVVFGKLQELYLLGNTATVKDKGLITVLELSYEMYKRKLEFLNVDLYKSHSTKFLIVDNKLRPPLSSLQGVGVNAAKSIEIARENGEFISKEDLRLRTKVSKTVIETMDNHGMLKGMSETNQLCLF